MEFGALLILILVVLVVGVLGGGVYAVAAKGRRRQLDPDAEESGEDARPEHRRVSNEQKTHFVHDR